MTAIEIAGVHLTEWGTDGTERVVLVHGGDPFGGASTWGGQQPLADRWHLLVPDRPGHGQSPRQGGDDFERDAGLLMPLLDGGPAHLVGASYGGVVVTYMAMRRPDAVRSLALLEAPLTTLVENDPAARDFEATATRLFTETPDDPVAAVNEFFRLVGIDRQLPEGLDPVPDLVLTMARELREIRPPHDAVIDVDALRRGGYPVLTLTSGRTPGFEVVSAALVEQLGAEHVIVPGTDHSVQRGEGVNDLLARLWTSAAA
jgi:pimeloyl-ACP methyl ester carboxylesterase